MFKTLIMFNSLGNIGLVIQADGVEGFQTTVSYRSCAIVPIAAPLLEAD